MYTKQLTLVEVRPKVLNLVVVSMFVHLVKGKVITRGLQCGLIMLQWEYMYMCILHIHKQNHRDTV